MRHLIGRKKKKKTCKITRENYVKSLQPKKSIRVFAMFEKTKSMKLDPQLVKKQTHIGELVDEFKLEYPTYIEKTKYVIGEVDKIEEEILQYIQFIETNDHLLKEMKVSCMQMQKEKDINIKELEKNKKELISKVKSIEESMHQMTKKNKSFDEEKNGEELGEIMNIILMIYSNFRSKIDSFGCSELKKDKNSKSNMLNFLKGIEIFLYKIEVGIKSLNFEGRFVPVW